MNQIIYQNYPKANYLKKEKRIINTITKVLNSGNYILGSETKKFEEEFAEYNNCKYGIGVGNGTDALTLSLRSIKIADNDEIITVANTAAATISAIVQSGAKPIYVDINEKSFNINIDLIEKNITNRTKAIVIVHLFGNPVNPEPIKYLAKKYKLNVIEDCAQAHGAMYNGRKVGSFFDLSAFSFYPTKNLGCYGDAGIILTDKKSSEKKIKALRQYGWEDNEKYCFQHGFNSRIDEIQSSILRLKLNYLDKENKKRNKIASIYNEYLSGNKKIIIPTSERKAFHVYHQYVVKLKVDRKEFMKRLFEKGITTSIHYPIPLHKQQAYKINKSLPATEKISKQIVSLPMYPELNGNQIKYICSNIIKVLSEL